MDLHTTVLDITILLVDVRRLRRKIAHVDAHTGRIDIPDIAQIDEELPGSASRQLPISQLDPLVTVAADQRDRRLGMARQPPSDNVQ